MSTSSAIAELVDTQNDMNINETMFFFFYNLAHQSSFFDGLIVFFAVYFPYIVILLALVFLLFHYKVLPSSNPFEEFINRWKEIILVFFSSGLAWIVSQILKFLIHTPRPFDAFPQVIPLFSESGFAFPSGHATFFMGLAVALFFINKKISYLFMFFALIIGLARIIAGVHFPVDILGGFILGSLVSALVAYLVKNV